MYVRYGSFTHADNTVTISDFSRQVNFERGAAKTALDRMVLEGELIADTQNSIRTAIVNLEKAYLKQNQEVALYHNDGTKSAHFLSPTGSIGGVRVTSIRYPKGDGAEYATARTFQITLEAEYPLNGETDLVEWSESIEIQGTGGPKFVVVQLINGTQRQEVATRTPVRASQRGQAVGYLSYPFAPIPYWPAHEQQEQRRLSRRGPERDNAGFRNYGVSWSYSFLSAGPLTGGIPTQR